MRTQCPLVTVIDIDDQKHHFYFSAFIFIWKKKKKKKINALSLIVKILPLFDHYLRETKSQKRDETGGNSTLERQSAHFNNKTI